MDATVLHISDLHRDSGSAISTATLLESLRLDRERYAKDGTIPKPDIAIVSGDIVYGVKGDSADAEARLREQYDEALEFLSKLADLFFDGDRERVVMGLSGFLCARHMMTNGSPYAEQAQVDRGSDVRLRSQHSP